MLCFALVCFFSLTLFYSAPRRAQNFIWFDFNNNFNFSFFFFLYFFSPDFVVVPTSKTALETRIEFSSLPLTTTSLSVRTLSRFLFAHSSFLRLNFVISAHRATAITFSSSFFTARSPLSSLSHLTRSSSPFLANLSRSHFPSLPLLLVTVAGAAPLRDCMLIGDFGSHLEHCFRSSSSASPPPCLRSDAAANFAEEQKVVRDVCKLAVNLLGDRTACVNRPRLGDSAINYLLWYFFSSSFYPFVATTEGD